MIYTAEEVYEFVKQEDVKFIRLAFCDIKGRQKNISIMILTIITTKYHLRVLLFLKGISFV